MRGDLSVLCQKVIIWITRIGGAFYVWDCLENIEEPTLEDKRKSLMTDNIHGRCVWDCEHTVVDHQSVLMNFADGATATLNMIGGAAKPERNIHIIGTKG